ncbi:MAG: GTPase ObgE [bacterium]
MFIDKVKIFLKAGNGGQGCLSFLRDKVTALGGPNGGSGGRGGNIYMQADPNLTTLVDFTYKPHFQSQIGEGGMGKNKNGRDAEDVIIFVPCGTIVHKNNVFFHDFSLPHEKILVVRGGRGGRGNAAFKTHRKTAPRIKENGEPGEEAICDLELKLIADVGLVGFPNAGKSTLLSRVSAAHPKIADYPFTTLTPNLGVVKHYEKSFVIADIPGIIEGAHQGKGLGIAFLKHIERTRLLVHVVDMFGFDGKSAAENFKIINKELAQYSRKLSKKPMIAALNKADLSDFTVQEKLFFKQLKKSRSKTTYFPISAVSGKGIKELLDGIIKKLDHMPVKVKTHIAPRVVTYTLDNHFTIDVQQHRFVVKGRKVENLVLMTPMGLRESVWRMQNILKKMGVDRALKKKGVKAGDTVKIGNLEFDWEE